MSREKQKLECEMAEMLEIIEKAREIYANDITDHTENEYIREGLLDAGYRKQSGGEWETIPDYSRELITYRHICSECKTFYKDIRPHGHKFCHECGAKMKGGE